MKQIFNMCDQKLFRMRQAINEEIKNKIQRISVKSNPNNDWVKLGIN